MPQMLAMLTMDAFAGFVATIALRTADGAAAATACCDGGYVHAQRYSIAEPQQRQWGMCDSEVEGLELAAAAQILSGNQPDLCLAAEPSASVVCRLRGRNRSAR